MEEFQQKIAIEVALSVVGESYSRFDSISSYYACLTFVFNEPTQIKVPLLKKADEFTEADIFALKTKMQAYANLTYKGGPVRGNYVSADKRF